MKNLFQAVEHQEILSRLSKLSAESQPLWGKMTVAQMLCHCKKPLDVAEGTLTLKPNLIGFLFGKMAKNKFLKSETPFGKNSPTAKEFKIREPKNFEQEYAALLDSVTRFGTKGHAFVQNIKHPFFGKMTYEDWGILQYKHLDHHLQQFGV